MKIIDQKNKKQYREIMKKVDDRFYAVHKRLKRRTIDASYYINEANRAIKAEKYATVKFALTKAEYYAKQADKDGFLLEFLHKRYIHMYHKFYGEKNNEKKIYHNCNWIAYRDHHIQLRRDK